MKNGFYILLGLLLIACSQNGEIPESGHTKIIGLASPIVLQPNQTTIHLKDYFLQPELIDSIHVPDGLTHAYSAQDSTEIILSGNSSRAYTIFSAYSGNQRFDIPVKRSSRIAYTLSFGPTSKEYETIQVKGSFNAWNPNTNTLEKDENGVFKTELQLQPGAHEYLFVVDGKEMLDPANAETVSNGQGGYNSVLRIEDNSQDPTPVKSLSTTENGFSLLLNKYSESGQDLFVLWQNHLLKPTQSKGDTIYFTIPDNAKSMERSFIRAFTGNETKFGNDLLIPLDHGKVVVQTTQLHRNDWETAMMYFLMVDRFKNGNPANDSTVHNDSIDPRANYYGGDIAGVTDEIKAGFFDSLGINTVWISPITQNPWDAWGFWDKGGITTKFSGYHGYWPISNVNPDKRFGTRTEVHAFVDAAHQDDKNVLLDYVANHVHQLHPIYQNNKDWATDLYLPDGTMNTEKWDEHRLTTWFDTFLPTLDLRRPEVVEPLVDSAMIWLEEFHFDGFRHDATKHIDELYWRELTEKVKNDVVLKDGKRVYQIGETYGSAELIASYIGTGMLDAQFNFNLYDATVGTLANKNTSFNRIKEVLESSLQWYGANNLMGNISGNQDRARFISYASGDVSFTEDAKLAGWTREIGKPSPEAYKKLALLHAFNFSIPGIPVIYYGDEYGMPGANDPDNRRQMKFNGYDADESELLETVKNLAHLRKNNMALNYGSTDITVFNDDVMIIHRQYFNDHVWFILNKGNETASIPMSAINLQEIENIEEGPAGDLSVIFPNAGDILFAVNPNGFGTLITVTN